MNRPNGIGSMVMLVASAMTLMGSLGAGPAAAQDIKLRMGASSNIAFGPNFVLDDKTLGIAAKHGIDISVKIFATGVATSVLLIAAHDRPFTGQISVSPEPLRQIMPEEAARRT